MVFLVQLQHQLEVTSNLCQSMLLEQSQQQQHGNNLLTSVGVGNNLLPHWGFPPPPYPSTPHPQAHSVIAGKIQLVPTLHLCIYLLYSVTCNSDVSVVREIPSANYMLRRKDKFYNSDRPVILQTIFD